jgi:tRNA modification GTPase
MSLELAPVGKSPHSPAGRMDELMVSVDSTIAAVASPAGTGGISIIKISGPAAIAIATSIFRPASTAPPATPLPGNFESHRLYYGHIMDERSGRSLVLDEVLLAVMKAPRSYTREDVVEINCHGGPASAHVVLDLVLCKGARLAEPGEFTRRAFLNGRIDLTQAEAVIDLINARSKKALEINAAQIGGLLRRELEAIRSFFFEMLVRNEAAIDFPEDLDEAMDGPSMSLILNLKTIRPMEQLLRNYDEGHFIREGLTVAIVGRPNVGKSSLMNQLLARDRAIVTPYAGTTRDAIEDILSIQGMTVSLWDTAGLHESRDPVEAVGIQKSFERIKTADLILLVLEAHRPLSEDDFGIYDKIGSKPILYILNKVDLLNGGSPPDIIPGNWVDFSRLNVSALTGQGIEALRQEILAMAKGEGHVETASAIIPNLRQKALLERCIRAARAAKDSLESKDSPELVDIHLRDALNSIDEILGAEVKADILDEIFSRFCIGK